MANKVIELTSNVKPITGLEVYRDISMKADLNLANILKSYREVVPLIELSGSHTNSGEIDSTLSNYMIQGEISALDFVKLGFNIKAQISDTYYVEEYGQDLEDFTLYLWTEENPASLTSTTDKNLVEIEGAPYNKVLILKDDGQVSALANWRERLMWNPYKLAKLVNVLAVFNSIHNIFTWTPGERILNPEFGNNLKKYLYEGINEFTSESITAEIRRCINEYEPRAHIVSINNVSNINDTENNTILIDIVFTIPSLSRELFVYSYTYKYNNNE